MGSALTVFSAIAAPFTVGFVGATLLPEWNPFITIIAIAIGVFALEQILYPIDGRGLWGNLIGWHTIPLNITIVTVAICLSVMWYRGQIGNVSAVIIALIYAKLIQATMFPTHFESIDGDAARNGWRAIRESCPPLFWVLKKLFGWTDIFKSIDDPNCKLSKCFW